MATKKRPSLGVVILYYAFAFGMFILFGPSAYFQVFKTITQGIVYEFEAPVTRVKYYADDGEEYLTSTEGIYHRSDLKVGEKVKVFYLERNPKEVLLPDFDGYGFPILYMTFLLMGVAAAFFMHRDYLRYR